MAGSESLRDRWLRMSPAERSALAPSGKECVDCGEPAGTPWGPYFCPDCDDKRLDRISASLKQIDAGFASAARQAARE